MFVYIYTLYLINNILEFIYLYIVFCFLLCMPTAAFVMYQMAFTNTVYIPLPRVIKIIEIRKKGFSD